MLEPRIRQLEAVLFADRLARRVVVQPHALVRARLPAQQEKRQEQPRHGEAGKGPCGRARVAGVHGAHQRLNAPCSRAFVPEGHLAIARRFNAGFARTEGQVPKGRPIGPLVFSRPFGTEFLCGLSPALKCRAILDVPPGQNAWTGGAHKLICGPGRQDARNTLDIKRLGQSIAQEPLLGGLTEQALDGGGSDVLRIGSEAGEVLLRIRRLVLGPREGQCLLGFSRHPGPARRAQGEQRGHVAVLRPAGQEVRVVKVKEAAETEAGGIHDRLIHRVAA